MRRVLSLWQPHASLTVGFNGAGTTPPMPAKRYETRHFQPRYPLPIDVVIHAAKRWNREESERITTWPFACALERADYSLRDPSKDYSFTCGREYNGSLDGPDTRGRRQLPLGMLIGVATIVSVVPTTSLLTEWSRFEDGAAERYAEEVAFGNYEAGRFGWELANSIELPTIIPFRGRQDVLYELDAKTDAYIDDLLAGRTP